MKVKTTLTPRGVAPRGYRTTPRTALRVCGVALLLAAACAAAAAADDAPPPPGPVQESDAAKQAGIRYDRELGQARQEFERKLLALQQEYDAKAAAARKTYSSALKLAQAEETRKGRLELALLVKNRVASVEAEGPMAWPPVTLPAPKADPAGAAGVPGAAAAAGPARKSLVIRAADLKDLAKEFTVDGDVDIRAGALHVIKGQSLESKFRLAGDFKVFIQGPEQGRSGGWPFDLMVIRCASVTFENAWGEIRELNRGKLDRTLIIERVKDRVRLVSGAGTVLVEKQIPENLLNQPTSIVLADNGNNANGTQIVGIRVEGRIQQ